MGQVSLYRLWRTCAFPDFITWPHACHNSIILLAYLRPQILQVLFCRSRQSSNGRIRKLFVSHTCGWQKRGQRLPNVYPHVIFQPRPSMSFAKLPPHNYFTLYTTHACSWKAWVPRLHYSLNTSTTFCTVDMCVGI